MISLAEFGGFVNKRPLMTRGLKLTFTFSW